MVEAAKGGVSNRRSLVLRTVYALCLLGATYNHAATIFQHGLFWDYGGVPRASAAFWTMLAVLDPAAVVLLFVRPNAGVAATAAIIIVDVIHNLWIGARYFPSLLDGLAHPQVIAQIVFMLFVVVTAPFAWITSKRGAL